MKMNNGIGAILAAVFAFSCAGCTIGTDEVAEERVTEADLALVVVNGMQMNGTQINGVHANGIKMNGIKMNGIKMNGIKMNGTSLEGTVETTGETVEGTGFSGTSMEAVLANNTTANVFVESISTTEVPGYHTYIVKENGVSICGNDAQGNPISAIALEGTWDYVTGAYLPSTEQFTMACRGAAIAKCVEWGYDRWDGYPESKNGSNQTVPYRYFHEACVRMVRADYCGNGVPNTVDGTTIDVWDTASIQVQTLGAGFLPEAEWSASGATCIKRSRHETVNGVNVQQYIQTHCPSRWAPTSTSCMGGAAAGSPFFTQNGFGMSFETRPLLRNASGATQ